VRYEIKQRYQKSRMIFFRFCISTLFEQMPKKNFFRIRAIEYNYETYSYEISYYVSKDNDGNNGRKIIDLKF